MNYSKDEVHSRIALLHSTCSKHIREFNQFNQTMTVFSNYTAAYIDRLKELKEAVIDLKFDSAVNSLYEVSMKTLVRYINQQIEGLEIFAEGILNGIVDESSKFIAGLPNTNRTLFESFTKLEQEMTKEANSLMVIQGDYMQKMKAFELALTECLSKNVSAIELEVNMHEGIVMRNKLEANYLCQIGKANKMKSHFLEASSGFLAKYNEIFNSIADRYLKGFNSFKSILTLKLAHDKYLIQDIEDTLPLIDQSQLQYNKGLFKTIPCDSFNFKPYSLSILKEKQQKSSNSTISFDNDNVLTYNVVTFMQKHFISIAENYDAVEEKKKNEVLRISNLIYENNHSRLLSQEDQTQIENLFKVPRYRLIFLSFLNKKRVEGNCNLSKESFKQLGDIMRYIIDCIQEDKEYESMRYCLIMCQTYWLANSNNERVYLQASIENHPLFQNEDFWEFFFSDSLHQEITKQQKAEVNHKETDEEKNHRFGNVAFSQLISLGHSMMDFNVNKSKIKKIITVFAQQYCVSQELIKQIYELINEVAYESKSLSNESIDSKPEANLNIKPVEALPQETKPLSQSNNNECDIIPSQNGEKFKSALIIERINKQIVEQERSSFNSTLNGKAKK